jgi:hypothetical protein
MTMRATATIGTTTATAILPAPLSPLLPELLLPLLTSPAVPDDEDEDEDVDELPAAEFGDSVDVMVSVVAGNVLPLLVGVKVIIAVEIGVESGVVVVGVVGVVGVGVVVVRAVGVLLANVEDCDVT